MRERVVTFGADNALVGILTETGSDDDTADRPAVLILNSGILHRVGANRLHVRLARRLADRGFPALRFDHAGIGDSGARRDDRSFRESAIGEVRAAMDLMERTRGIGRFVLAGLCSGSDASYWAALEDDRVSGLVQLDPFVYRTPRFYLRHYLPRLVSPRAWWRSLSSRVRNWRRRRRDRRAGSGMAADWSAPEYTRVFPPRLEIAEGLGALSDRGTEFFVFISGTMTEYVNDAEQYRDSFPEVSFRDRLKAIYRPQADHTLSDLAEQDRLLTAIERWASDRWPTVLSSPSALASHTDRTRNQPQEV